MRLYNAKNDEMEIYRIKNAMQRIQWKLDNPHTEVWNFLENRMIPTNQAADRKQSLRLMRIHRDRLNEIGPV